MKTLPVSPFRSPSVWLAAALALACLGLVKLFFFSTVAMEWELQALRGGGEVNVILIAKIFGVAVAAALLAAWVFFRGALKGGEALVLVYCVGLVFILMVLSFMATRVESHTVLKEAWTARNNVVKAEEYLGRTTATGDLFRASIGSLQGLMDNQDLVKKLASSRHDPRGAMDVASMAYVLGPDHPVVRFTVESGLVQEDATEILSRDFLEHLRQNPDLSADPQITLLLSRLGGRP